MQHLDCARVTLANSKVKISSRSVIGYYPHFVKFKSLFVLNLDYGFFEA